MAQVQVLADELSLVKAEVVNVKSSHAALHAITTEGNTAAAQRFALGQPKPHSQLCERKKLA